MLVSSLSLNIFCIVHCLNKFALLPKNDPGINISDKLLKIKKNKKLNLAKMGNIILKKSVIEIDKVLNNELKKT